MAKPKQIFLLEVSYPEGSYRHAPSGGIFRTERDMKTRISTVRSRSNRAGKPYTLTTSVLDAVWSPLDL